MEKLNSLPVAVIGAGPIGLAVAAHLAVRNQPFVLFEAGGTVAANILTWQHIRVFSPWRYNIDKAAAQLLAQTSWQRPANDDLPTGKELYQQYLKPLSGHQALRPHIHLHSKVMAVGRTGLDKMKTNGRDRLPYTLQVLQNGTVQHYQAKAVIDTSGTWHMPNPVGAAGTFAVCEQENSSRIFYGIPDILGTYAARYKNKRVLVVGSGHSSINAILELDKLKEQYPDTQIHWAMRRQNMRAVYGGQENDALTARGALGSKIEHLVQKDRVNIYTPFHIQEVVDTGDSISVVGLQNDIRRTLPGIDEIISNTGSRPDFGFLREVRLSIDSSLESVAAIADLIDPNIHSCGTVRPHGEKELRQPDAGFYIAGAKSYGRAPTFLMATGYEQVRSIVAAIDGDLEAAANVELDLPETGVCNANTQQSQTSSSPCCMPEADSQACCTPSKSVDENNGACCLQPVDGSACCNK